MRKIYNPTIDDSAGTQPVALGGLGSRKLDKATENIGLLTMKQSGKPNGVILLNASGKIGKSSLPPEISDPTIPSISGPSEVEFTRTIVLTITNYDTFVGYSLTATGGFAVRSGEEITFTANSVEAMGGVTVNGRTFPISVKRPLPQKPTIFAPGESDQLISNSSTIAATGFLSPAGFDTHTSSDWELATDAAFSSIVDSAYQTSTFLTSWTVNNMQELTKHYVRVRYHGQSGKLSPWSDPVSFTTGNDGFINTEVQKLMAGDVASNARFGEYIGVDATGTHMLVGCSHDNQSASASGAIYYFKYENGAWIQKQKIKLAAPVANEGFGQTLMISADGTFAIVGAAEWPASNGAAYVFTRSGDVWTQGQKLTASDGAVQDYFGGVIALSRDQSTLAISACYNNGGRGAIYIFTKSAGSWVQQAKLVAADSALWNDLGYLGLDLSSDGNYLIAGAHGADTAAGADAGATYIFLRTGTSWVQQAKLVAPDPAAGDQFGFATAMSADGATVLISAIASTTRPGAVYVFTRVGTLWTYQTKLTANNGVVGDRFGQTLEFSSNLLLVGATTMSAKGAASGSVYVFTLTGTTWTQQRILTGSDETANDWFGFKIFLADDAKSAYIFALNNAVSASSGAVYSFR